MKKQGILTQKVLMTVIICIICTMISSLVIAQTNDWIIGNPEEEGMSLEALDKQDQSIRKKPGRITSLLIIKNNKLIYEKYYGVGGLDRRAEIYSVTKSFTGTLIGIALDKKFIPKLDMNMSDFFPDYCYYAKDIEPYKKNLTLKDILSMNINLEWKDDWDTGMIALTWYHASDKIQAFFDLPIAINNDKQYNYNTAGSHMLSAILTRSAKMDTLDFARKYLFEPLGIEDYYWPKLEEYYFGGAGLELTPRDIAKLGLLYLNNGVWKGKQIVSSEWIKEATKPHTLHTKDKAHYGYQWWVIPVNQYESYRAWGAGGQYCVVIPELKMVIVVTSSMAPAGMIVGTPYNFPLIEEIAKAVKQK